jgi:D-psicose/D-tagatose/L-ribulose 3-epimerase
MRISISNIAWDVADDILVCEILKRHHVDAIDVAPGKYFNDFSTVTTDQVKRVRCWWADRGIEIIGMQSLFYGTKGFNLFASLDTQQRMLDHLSNVCRIGDSLNARRLVFGSPRNRDRSGLSDEQAHEIAIEFFMRLAIIADHYGVTICLEPNPKRYKCNFMTTSSETAAIVEAISHPSLMMQLDTGAIFINEEQPFSICSDFQHLIGHIHVSEPELVPIGKGQIDHYQLATALSTLIPHCIVTIEMLTNAVQDVMAEIDSAVCFVTGCYGPRRQ